MNFGFGAIGLAAQFAMPLGVVGGAVMAHEIGFGLVPSIGAPAWLALLLLILGRSFASYWIHRAMHKFDIFWRFHSLHHSDRALDLSTTFRNHPGELLLTLPTVTLVGFAIGCPPEIALAGETIIFAAALLAHTNLQAPAPIDRVLHSLLVTPAVHTAHHERNRVRADGNYGELLIIWDRLFGTWHEPRAEIVLGLDCEYGVAVSGELGRPFRKNWQDTISEADRPQKS